MLDIPIIDKKSLSFSNLRRLKLSEYNNNSYLLFHCVVESVFMKYADSEAAAYNEHMEA